MNIRELSQAVGIVIHSWSTTTAVVIVVAVLVAGALLLRWFARQPGAVRRDVIGLIRALRGK